MKAKRRTTWVESGISLVETMVAVGVLALVIPLALAAILKAGDSGSAARAETRAPAIAEMCLEAVDAARKGKSPVFPQIDATKEFPAPGQILGLVFGREGRVLGRISKAQYDAGVKKLGNDAVHYIAIFSGKPGTGKDAGQVTLTVSVEYPAVLKSVRRSSVSFYTKLP